MEMVGTNTFHFCFSASAMLQTTHTTQFSLNANTDWVLFHGEKVSIFCLGFNTFKKRLERSVERL